ncbi:hypothetical protein E2C01_037136 [Portunus trituberculatus]|uniref:Uncharacterized protein n=1 Tax=Portunus trituberculatus TaxID=210409 RepID=A0A5B7FD59_PORTR|nr:hypothetical protein [Portunus trituberculatus]
MSGILELDQYESATAQRVESVERGHETLTNPRSPTCHSRRFTGLLIFPPFLSPSTLILVPPTDPTRARVSGGQAGYAGGHRFAIGVTTELQPAVECHVVAVMMVPLYCVPAE